MSEAEPLLTLGKRHDDGFNVTVRRYSTAISSCLERKHYTFALALSLACKLFIEEHLARPWYDQAETY